MALKKNVNKSRYTRNTHSKKYNIGLVLITLFILLMISTGFATVFMSSVHIKNSISFVITLLLIIPIILGIIAVRLIFKSSKTVAIIDLLEDLGKYVLGYLGTNLVIVITAFEYSLQCFFAISALILLVYLVSIRIIKYIKFGK